MHGDDQIRLDQADHLCGFRSIQAASTAHRHKRDIDRAQRFDLGLRGGILQVAQMRDRDPVIIKNVNGIPC